MPASAFGGTLSSGQVDEWVGWVPDSGGRCTKSTAQEPSKYKVVAYFCVGRIHHSVVLSHRRETVGGI